MSVVAPRGVGTRACKKLRTLDVQADVVIPFDVIVTHVLREENLPDPADLAVLLGACCTMRDAVMRRDVALRSSMKLTLLAVDI